MDRILSIALFVTAIGCFGGAVLQLLNSFIEYLQAGYWHSTTLLQFGYDTSLVRARWFLANPWSWWMHDLLASIPTYAALLATAPVAWWLSGRIESRR